MNNYIHFGYFTEENSVALGLPEYRWAIWSGIQIVSCMPSATVNYKLQNQGWWTYYEGNRNTPSNIY